MLLLCFMMLICLCHSPPVPPSVVMDDLEVNVTVSPESRQTRHYYNVERGVKQTDDLSGIPVALDNILDQTAALTTGKEGEMDNTIGQDCVNGSALSELDICLAPGQAAMFDSVRGQSGSRKKRQQTANVFSLWKDGVIPYIFYSTFPQQDRDAIQGAMAEWENATCVRFRPSNERDPDVVVFRDGRRCSTNIGRIGREQFVFLARSCRSKRILIHELGHVIGLIHEHQRYDRDKYVKVILENVRNLTQERYQFSKLLATPITDKNVRYDYTSIMHYGRNYFAKSPELTTLQTSDPLYQDTIGKAEKPSFSDIETVNQLYHCSNMTTLDPGSHRSNLLDSTCDFFASRGECLTPLCAKYCRFHQVVFNASFAVTSTSAPSSDRNQLQRKSLSSPWRVNSNRRGSLDARRNASFNTTASNVLRDVHILRSTKDVPSITAQQSTRVRQQKEKPLEASHLERSNLLAVSNTQRPAVSQLIQQGARKTFPSVESRSSLLKQTVNNNTTSKPPAYQRFTFNKSTNQRFTFNRSTNQRFTSNRSTNQSNSRIVPHAEVSRRLQETGVQLGSPFLGHQQLRDGAKHPSMRLRSLQPLHPSGASIIRSSLKRVPGGRRLADFSQEWQNNDGIILNAQPTTRQGQLIDDIHIARNFGEVSNGKQENWLVNAGTTVRNYQSSFQNIQNIGIRNSALQVLCHLYRCSTALPTKTGPHFRRDMPGTRDMPRMNGHFLPTDVTGPEYGQLLTVNYGSSSNNNRTINVMDFNTAQVMPMTQAAVMKSDRLHRVPDTDQLSSVEPVHFVPPDDPLSLMSPMVEPTLEQNLGNFEQTQMQHSIDYVAT